MLSSGSDAQEHDATVGALGCLRDVFPNGESIYAVADDERLAAAAGELGCIPVMLQDLTVIPPGANVIVFLKRTFITERLRRAFRSAAALVVPISSFDSGMDAALYTQQLVFRTDYAAACARNRHWVETITNEPGPLIFASEDPGDGQPRTELTCRLGDDIRADTCLKPQLTAGDWVSIGSYCEFALVATSIDDTRSLDIDGTVQVAGILTAEDARATAEGTERCRAARELRQTMAALAPITLRMEGGLLASVMAGEEDFTDALLQVTSPEYGRNLLELGIGTNEEILPWVDWSVNSQLNEGAGPVHLGFGDGITGAHVDFLVRNCSHRFDAAMIEKS
jgi:hypothetical protein